MRRPQVRIASRRDLSLRQDVPVNSEQARGTLLGLAVGDALGAPLEFFSPVTAAAAAASGLEMSGGGPWLPGEWTDDTAMALCLAESIVDHRLLDLDDLACRYAAWAASGPKDIGIATRKSLRGVRSSSDALANAKRLHQETGRTAGNGTIMRAAPVALAARTPEEASEVARADARLTHFDPMAGAASAALCAALMALGAGGDPFEVVLEEVELHLLLVDAALAARGDDRTAVAALAGGPQFGTCWAAVAAVAGGPQFGTCWAALAVGLCALHLPGYEAGVTWAVSLGQDADTNAAIAGALLGCRSGGVDVPARWLEPLFERERISGLAEGLAARS
jgi:ADP-ribosylglycohydrolase